MSGEMPDRILRHLSQSGYRPQKTRALARSMGIADQEYNDFRSAVKELMAAGRIVLGSKNALMLAEPTGAVVGTYRANPRGFGFVVPQSPTAHGDLYIPEGESLDAITGDTVRARVLKRGKRRGEMIYHGRITEVLDRAANQFVGQLRRDQGRWFVWPDGKTLNVPIFVSDVGAKGAKLGDQVVVEIISFPTAETRAKGVIIERLGRRDDPGVDVRSIVRQYNIPDEFPPAVRDEARRVIGSFDLDAELERREDFRDLLIVTIDPETARDFDDAISLRKLSKGRWELGVHIADVSAFVREGSELDAEARLRGNSTYLPQYVVPMLPEVLSNGLCSLQEGEPRLVKSVFIEYGRDGDVLSSRYANGVISSAQRFTYDEVTQVLAGKTGGYRKDVVGLLKDMEKLARVIQRRRLDEGMIVLDLPEIELDLDEDGHVVDAHPADTSFSHTIIEMFMVEANEAVARLFDGLDVPFLRRIHPDPPAESSRNVARFVKVLGHTIKGPLDRQAMLGLLASVKGRPEAIAVNIAVLRSMEAASYSPQKVGHFALASEWYCHFTSPIRRYPDLAIHRLLDRHFEGRLRRNASPASMDIPDAKDLAALGAHCSFTERRSEQAERESKLVKVLELLSQRIGEVFDGLVTGVANVGVFVQCIKYGVDGLIRFNDLPDDWWDIDAASGSAVGERSGRRITIGDTVQVEVLSVDVPGRLLDLGLVQHSRPRDKDEKQAKPSRRQGKSKGGGKAETQGKTEAGSRGGGKPKSKPKTKRVGGGKARKKAGRRKRR